MRAWLSCGALHGFALGQPRPVPTAQGVLPMSIPPRLFRTVSLARALAFALIAAPCVYAQSGTPAGGADVAPESAQSTRDTARDGLRDAASQGDLAEVERLLKAGADVNAKNKNGWTPLHAAAGSNLSPAVLEVLLKAGADVNAKTADGVTPLHLAAANNPSPAVLEVLLKAGADPRAINKDGKAPHAVAKPEYIYILRKAMMDKPQK
jgi:Ankyrin repeats (3 copies)